MRFIPCLGPLFLAVTPVTAWAGGFAINENSAADLGRANTGRVTHIQDASAAYGNPALMTQFQHLTLSNTGSYISGETAFEDSGSVDAFGQSLGGDTDGFFDSALVPALHLVYPVSDTLAVGLSLASPYGLSSTYEDGWAGRYQGLGSELITLNVNPSIAYALNDRFSIGAGFNVQYARAELSNAVDFGTICFVQIDPATCTPLGLTPQNADGLFEVDGDDFSFGYNIGVSVTPSDTLKLGAHFRSRVRHDIEGTADFTVPDNAQILTANGSFTDTEGTAELPLPGFFEIGLAWKASERLSLYSNFIRTYWSDLEELRIDFDNPAQADSVEELNFRNSDRYGAGAEWDLNENWALRVGFSFDEGAAVAQMRSVRIPDNNRFIYAGGASYTGLDEWRFDVAYNRFRFENTDFNRVGPTADMVSGEIDAVVNVFSLGVTRHF